MRVWNKIFKDIELADFLGVTLDTVRHYPKNKLELMRFGFACKKLEIDFNDLAKLKEEREKLRS